MRILKICYEFPPLGGGGSRVVEGLSCELVRQGHQVDLVTMGFHGLAREENRKGVSVYRVPCLRLDESVCRPSEMVTYLLMAFPYLLKLTRKNQYDLNHTHFIFPDGVLAYFLYKFRGIPYIITAHGSDVPGYNPDRFGFLHQVLMGMWKEIVNHAAYIVSPSRTLAKLIRSQGITTQLIEIPNGITIQSFDTSLKEPNRVLLASRIFERKGFQYFLQALDGLPARFKVDIVGEGPYLPELKQIAANLDTDSEIIFHEWLDNESLELKELFEKASIFVLPSSSENFPVSLLEAMSAYMAIITTKGTGCQDVVGDAALLVPPENVDAIRAALIKLYEYPELQKELGMQGRKRVEKQFSWKSVTQRYLELYRKVLAET